MCLIKWGTRLVPFIRMYMSKKQHTGHGTTSAISSFFGLAGYLMVAGYGKADFHLGNQVTHFCYGLAIALTLVPLHEFIRVLAYRSQGANNIVWCQHKKFYFMALADKFVANRKNLQSWHLAPFLIIHNHPINIVIHRQKWLDVTIAGILTRAYCH